MHVQASKPLDTGVLKSMLRVHKAFAPCTDNYGTCVVNAAYGKLTE